MLVRELRWVKGKLIGIYFFVINKILREERDIG